MKTCLAIVGTLTGFARFFAFAIVALVVATQSLAESSKCDAKDVATIPDGMQWGVTFGFYGSDEYFASQAARDEIDAISRAGANWVTVVATVWQDTCQSTFQYRDFDLTPSDLTLKGIIDLVHAKGMKVCLRPMLECKDGYGRLAVWLPVAGGKRMFGRCSTARAEWFESLRKRSAYYARLARETGCEAFCIDSELDRMVEENDLWESVVDAVRKEYKGPVTSCHTLHTGTIDFLKTLADPGHWFHSLDYLSISYYCPARRKDEAGKVLTVDDMVRNSTRATWITRSPRCIWRRFSGHLPAKTGAVASRGGSGISTLYKGPIRHPNRCERPISPFTVRRPKACFASGHRKAVEVQNGIRQWFVRTES